MLQELGFHKVAVDFEHLMSLPKERLGKLVKAYTRGLDNTNATANQIQFSRRIIEPSFERNLNAPTIDRLSRQKEFWGTLTLRDKVRNSLRDAKEALRSKNNDEMYISTVDRGIFTKDPRGGYGKQYTRDALRQMLQERVAK